MKYIVVRARTRWEQTYWTKPDAPEGHPAPVDKAHAEAALAEARKAYPEDIYKLKKVSN